MPRAKVDIAITAGCTLGCVAAERAARDGHRRTNFGRIAERTSTRTGAGAAAGLVPGKRAVTHRGRAGTSHIKAADRTAKREDGTRSSREAPEPRVGTGRDGLVGVEGALVTVSAPGELSSMPPPTPVPAVLPLATLSDSVQLLMLRAALPSSRIPPPVLARPFVMVSPLMVTVPALPLMSKIRLALSPPMAMIFSGR